MTSVELHHKVSLSIFAGVAKKQRISVAVWPRHEVGEAEHAKEGVENA
jgi:hypothetical protein